MDKQTLHNKIIWDEYGVGSINIMVPLFGKELEFKLYTQEGETPEISEKMYCTVNDVQDLSPTLVETIKDLLWEEADFSFTVADYGCVPQSDETPKEAHFREFGLSNKDDCYAKCQVKGVQIAYESEQYNGRYAEIKIDTATDNLISIIVKNGKIIDYDDDGTYLGWFENDEQYAHNKRSKLL